MKRTRGVTLLEVLVGLGLASVLAGIGVGSLTALLDGLRLSGGARTAAATLRLARGRALDTSSSVDVEMDLAGSFLDVRAAGRLLERHVLPPGVRFADLPARGRVRFGTLGTAENATITLSAGSRTRRVIVNQRGRVRVP
jgi:prepilin-type N-terminal cleavage/methylation domain-containing protein